MSMEDIKGDIQKIGEAVNAFKSTDTKLEAEIKSRGEATAESKANLEKANEAISKLETKVDEAYAAMKRSAAGDSDKDSNTIDQKYNKAFLNFMRKNDSSEMHSVLAEARKGVATGEIEVKDLSRIVAEDGGFLVPVQISNDVITQTFDSNPLLELASRETISGGALEITQDLGDMDAEWVAERQARSKTDTPVLKVQKIDVFEMYAYPRATTQILEDASRNLEQWLSGKAADKFKRKLALAGLLGTGQGQPDGILTYPALAGSGPVVGQVEDVEFSTALVTADDLIDLSELKEEYLANAVYGMHRSTIKQIRKLKDSQGQYLWQPSLQAGVPSLFNGYPVRQFNDLVTAATTFSTDAVPVLFGDFKAGYKFVDRRGMKVIRDEITEPGFVKFNFSARFGGAVVNFEAIKRLKKA